MPTINNQKIGDTSPIANGLNHSTIIKHEVNIAKAVTSGMVSGDSITVISIPANTFVEILQVQNSTALVLGATWDIDLGDNTSAESVIASTTQATATSINNNFNYTLTAGALSGQLYTAANELKLRITAASLTSGKVRFVIRLTDTTANVPSPTPVF